MDILLHKTPSAPSFGHYWKQPIGSTIRYAVSADFYTVACTVHVIKNEIHYKASWKDFLWEAKPSKGKIDCSRAELLTNHHPCFISFVIMKLCGPIKISLVGINTIKITFWDTLKIVMMEAVPRLPHRITDLKIWQGLSGIMDQGTIEKQSWAIQGWAANLRICLSVILYFCLRISLDDSISWKEEVPLHFLRYFFSHFVVVSVVRRSTGINERSLQLSVLTRRRSWEGALLGNQCAKRPLEVRL